MDDVSLSDSEKNRESAEYRRVRGEQSRRTAETRREVAADQRDFAAEGQQDAESARTDAAHAASERALLENMASERQLQQSQKGEAESRSRSRGARKKVVRPSRRREMAPHAVDSRRLSIRLAGEAFTISQTCFRYVVKQSDEHTRIADWLLRLTTAHRTWGFGLCYLYLRNVKRFAWNHKRVYRIYRELELNLRIKPRNRLSRQAPGRIATLCDELDVALQS